MSGILRVVVEVAHHHLEVALEEARAQSDEHQGSQHHDQCQRVAAQGYGQQQIAGKHDEDADGHHAAEAELVGQPAAHDGQEIDEHEEVAVDFACPSGIESVVGTQKQCEDGEHGVVAESLARVGQCQRIESFWLIFEHNFKKLFNFRIFASANIKEVAQLDDDVRQVGASEIVALRVAVDVAQAVVVATLQEEMAHLGM